MIKKIAFLGGFVFNRGFLNGLMVFMAKLAMHRWMYCFFMAHLVAWTLVPAVVRYALPMDALEGTIWGRTFAFGYDKNPFLNGWLTRVAVFVGDYSDWVIYLFSQLSVVICFWAVWELAKKMLPPVYALMAVFLLEGVQYYNLHAIDFNDNTLELSLWALTILFFYRATRENNTRAWILTGLFAGLSMMTKYYTVMLLLPMLLFLIINPDARKQWHKKGCYLALILFLLIILPHVIWLFSHDFVTLDYAIDRVSSPPTWQNHVYYPLKFAWDQIQAFIPSLCLMIILMLGKLKPNADFFPLPKKLDSFDKLFLVLIGLGPFLLTVSLSFVMGIKLRGGWGQPLLSLWGILLVSVLRPKITVTRFYHFLIWFFSLFAITLFAYGFALIRAQAPSSANFPGKEIAEQLTHEWHEKYHKPLPYVAGPRWLAGNIAYYSKDHPMVYIDWDKKLSPWIDETKLKHDGALFVWDFSEASIKSPEEIHARFSTLGPVTIRHFAWKRNKNMEPVVISVAILRPQ